MCQMLEDKAENKISVIANVIGQVFHIFFSQNQDDSHDFPSSQTF